MKAQLNKDWKIMVRKVILDIYGSNIANYSATGKRANRPAIDHMLFKGLHGKYFNTFSIRIHMFYNILIYSFILI